MYKAPILVNSSEVSLMARNASLHNTKFPATQHVQTEETC